MSSSQQGNNHQSTADGNLFHLQQELLRQELPDQNSYREIQQNQSQRLEEYLARERGITASGDISGEEQHHHQGQGQIQFMMWNNNQHSEQQAHQEEQQQRGLQVHNELQPQRQQRLRGKQLKRSSHSNIDDSHAQSRTSGASAWKRSRRRSQSMNNISEVFDQQRRDLAALRDSILNDHEQSQRRSTTGHDGIIDQQTSGTPSQSQQEPLKLSDKEQMRDQLLQQGRLLQEQLVQQQEQFQMLQQQLLHQQQQQSHQNNNQGTSRQYNSFTMGSDCHNNNGNDNVGNANFELAMSLNKGNNANSNNNFDPVSTVVRRSYHDGMLEQHQQQPQDYMNNNFNNNFQSNNNEPMMMMDPPAPINMDNNMRRSDFYNDQQQQQQNQQEQQIMSFHSQYGGMTDMKPTSCSNSNFALSGSSSMFDASGNIDFASDAKRRNSIYVPAATALDQSQVNQQMQKQQQSSSSNGVGRIYQQEGEDAMNLSPCTLRLQQKSNNQASSYYQVPTAAAASGATQNSRPSSTSMLGTSTSINQNTTPKASGSNVSNASNNKKSVTKRPKVAPTSTNDMLLLEMLNDTVVSPSTANGKATFTSIPTSLNNIGMPNMMKSRQFQQHQVQQNTALMSSPLTHQNQVQNQNQVQDIPNSSSNMMMLMGNNGTPQYFADLFMGTTPSSGSIAGGGNNNIGVGLDLMSNMPPPPLVNMNTTTSPLLLCPVLKDDNAPLPLPPVSKKKSQQGGRSGGSSGGKKGGICKNSKKNKDGSATTGGGSASSSTGHKNKVDTSNHIITPLTATISALSKEIQSKMLEDEKALVSSTSSCDYPQEKNNKSGSSSSSNTASSRPSKGEARANSNNNDSGNNNTDDNKCSSGNDSSSNLVGDVSVCKFASAIEATQSSQQAIHDWDRKFGLRRAHSKTMRESCRSRKKVLDFLRGEGANILQMKKSLLAKSSSIDVNNARKDDTSSAAASIPEADPQALPSVSTETRVEKVEQADDDDQQKENKAIDASHHSMLDESQKKKDLDSQQQQDEACKQVEVSSVSRSSPDVSLANSKEGDVPEDNQEAHAAGDKPQLTSGQEEEQQEVSSAANTKFKYLPANLLPKQGSNSSGSNASVSSKLRNISDQHVELERMFRRASLECVDALMLPTAAGLRRPLPQESDFKQFHAKSA